MTDVLGKISIFQSTFKHFYSWIISEFKTKERVLAFRKSPNSIKVHYLTMYLEKRGVPILDALSYYAVEQPQLNFSDLQIYTIYKEFERIENKRITNYIPF